MSLKSQDAFLTQFYSLPVLCPSCGKSHSYIEARGGNDWSKDKRAECPNTGALLNVQVPVFGGEYYFTLASPVREMSEDEARDWDALNDQSDWMNDEQMSLEAEKIRAKYDKSI